VGDTVLCLGCGRVVDVARPVGVDYEFVRGRTADGRELITIKIGRVIVHRCVLCADGEWR
jgi:hypothetical protein